MVVLWYSQILTVCPLLKALGAISFRQIKIGKMLFILKLICQIYFPSIFGLYSIDTFLSKETICLFNKCVKV